MSCFFQNLLYTILLKTYCDTYIFDKPKQNKNYIAYEIPIKQKITIHLYALELVSKLTHSCLVSKLRVCSHFNTSFWQADSVLDDLELISKTLLSVSAYLATIDHKMVQWKIKSTSK